MNEITNKLHELIAEFHCENGREPTLITLGWLTYKGLQMESKLSLADYEIPVEPHIYTFNGINIARTKDNAYLIAMGFDMEVK